MQGHLHLEVHAHFEKVSTDTVFSLRYIVRIRPEPVEPFPRSVGGPFQTEYRYPFIRIWCLAGVSSSGPAVFQPLRYYRSFFLSTWICLTDEGSDVGTLYSRLGAVCGLLEPTFRWCIQLPPCSYTDLPFGCGVG